MDTIENLILKLQNAKSVLLSTHRNSDGDGLGAELALFHGLKKLGKQAFILNPDLPAKKYSFLNTNRWVQAMGATIPKVDLCLILDTNDRRLIEPLYSELEKLGAEIVFVDHHPVLEQGPKPTAGSVVDVSAASTGQMAFEILRKLDVPLDAEIARALYTSLVFDTQNFRYVKSDPASHLMAAELLRFEREPEEVHRRLFATYTVEKMGFFARTLAKVHYAVDGKVALIQVNTDEAKASGLDPDESGDLIDQVMNIESVQTAALMREDKPGEFKLSFRSKGKIPVLPIAEKLGGGGHMFASGAYVVKNAEELQRILLSELSDLVRQAK